MIFTDIFTETAYAQEQNDGTAVFKQLIQSVKDKEQIDLKVGVEQFPVRYDEARFLLSLWQASEDKPEMAKKFGYIRWYKILQSNAMLE